MLKHGHRTTLSSVAFRRINVTLPANVGPGGETHALHGGRDARRYDAAIARVTRHSILGLDYSAEQSLLPFRKTC